MLFIGRFQEFQLFSVWLVLKRKNLTQCVGRISSKSIMKLKKTSPIKLKLFMSRENLYYLNSFSGKKNYVKRTVGKQSLSLMS